MRNIENTINFQVSLICFGKGNSIPLHSHPQMTGVMLCAGGSLRVRSFDLLGEYSNAIATLKHKATKHLRLHDTDSLTAQQGNVHDVLANSPSQVIDIFSPPYNDVRIENTRWYDDSSNSHLSPGEKLHVGVLQ